MATSLSSSLRYRWSMPSKHAALHASALMVSVSSSGCNEFFNVCVVASGRIARDDRVSITSNTQVMWTGTFTMWRHGEHVVTKLRELPRPFFNSFNTPSERGGETSRRGVWVRRRMQSTRFAPRHDRGWLTVAPTWDSCERCSTVRIIAFRSAGINASRHWRKA